MNKRNRTKEGRIKKRSRLTSFVLTLCMAASLIVVPQFSPLSATTAEAADTHWYASYNVSETIDGERDGHKVGVIWELLTLQAVHWYKSGDNSWSLIYHPHENANYYPDDEEVKWTLELPSGGSYDPKTNTIKIYRDDEFEFSGEVGKTDSSEYHRCMDSVGGKSNGTWKKKWITRRATTNGTYEISAKVSETVEDPSKNCNIYYTFKFNVVLIEPTVDTSLDINQITVAKGEKIYLNRANTGFKSNSEQGLLRINKLGDTSIATSDDDDTRIYGKTQGVTTAEVYVPHYNRYKDSEMKTVIVVVTNPKPAMDNIIGRQVRAGETIALNITTSSGGELLYKSLDKSIATVDSNGIVTGIRCGETKIEITSKATNEYVALTRTISLWVTQGTGKITSDDSLILGQGETGSLRATTNSDSKIKYESSNTSVATVDSNGNIKAIAPGYAAITMSTDKTDSFSAASKNAIITVTAPRVQISAEPKTVKRGETVNLNATSAPKANLYYKSMDTSIATVDDAGNVTGLKGGTVDIEITTDPIENLDGGAKLVSVTVTPGDAEITYDYTVVAKDATLNIGAKTNSDGALSYKSSNPSVVSINSKGVMTGVAEGEATITITAAGTESYLEKSIEVPVTCKYKPQATIYTEAETYYVNPGIIIGKDLRNINASSNSGGELKYKTGNYRIAMIQSDGRILAGEEGTTKGYITVAETDEYLGATKTVTIVSVKKQNNSITYDKPSSIEIGKTYALNPTSASGDKVTVTSSNPSVATVDSNGNIKFLQGSKSVTFTMSVPEVNYYNSVKTTYSASAKRGTAEFRLPESVELMPGDEYMVDLTSLSPYYDGTPKLNSGLDCITVSKIDTYHWLAKVKDTATPTSNSNGLYVTADTSDNYNSYNGQGKAGGHTAVSIIPLVPGDKEPTIYANDARVKKDESVNIGAVSTSGTTLNYTSLTPELASVDSDGNVTGLEYGEAEIKITSNPNRYYAEGEKIIKVTVWGKEPTFTVDDSDIQYGETRNLNASVDSDAEIYYDYDNAEVLVVDDEGNITAVGVGTANVTVRCEELGIYDEGSYTFPVTVKKADPKITIGNNAVTYDETTNVVADADSGGDLHYSVSGGIELVPDSDGNYDGTIRGLSCEGESKVTVKVDATDNYNAGEETFDISVLQQYPEILIVNASLEIIKTDTKEIEAYSTSGNTVKFESDDVSIATVDENGFVTAVEEGSTTVRVIDEGSANWAPSTRIVNILVTPFETEGVEPSVWSVDPLVIQYNETKSLEAWSESGSVLTYISADTDTATVDNEGNITGIAPGETTVNITSAPTLKYGSRTWSSNIKVTGAETVIEAEDMILEYTDSNVPIGAAINSGADMTYSSRDNAIVTVDSEGNVTPHGIGETYIDIMSPAIGYYEKGEKEVKITVEKATPTITVKKTEVTYGKSVDMGAEVDSLGKLSFKSADENIVEADYGTGSGKLTGIAASSEPVVVTVTVESTDYYKGISQDFDVTVNKAFPTITTKNLTIPMTGKLSLDASSTAKDDPSYKLTYESQDEGIATVDENGLVTAVGEGKTTIAITSAETENYRERQKLAKIEVTEFIPGLNTPLINSEPYLDLDFGESKSLDAYIDFDSVISYESLDEEYAIVDENGLVTAVGLGEDGTAETTIVITTAPTLFYAAGRKEVPVRIKGAEPTIEVENMQIAFNETKAIEIDSLNSDGEVTYTSLNPTVATVDSSSGEVTGKDVNKARVRISVAASGGYKSTEKDVLVDVVKAKPEFTIENTTTTYNCTANLGASATSQNADGTGATLIYESLTPEIVTVNPTTGEFFGVAATEGTVGEDEEEKPKGKIRITATGTTYFESDYIDVEITVKQAEPQVEVDEMDVIFGETKLIETVTQIVGTRTYSSADDTIASVDETTGLVTGNKVGNTVVTMHIAESANYAAADVDINVHVVTAKPQIKPFDDTYRGYINGEPIDLAVTTGVEGLELEYEVEDPECAEVVGDGLIKMLKEGSTTVKISAANDVDNYDAPDPAEVTVIGVPTTPSAPNNVQAASGENEQITITWEEPDNDGGHDIDGYLIMRSEDGQSFITVAENLPNDQFTYVDDSAANGVTYTYRVYATNDVPQYRGDKSEDVQAKAYTLPGAPKEIEAEPVAPGEIELTWGWPDNGGDAITGYNIHVYTDEEYEQEVIENIDIVVHDEYEDAVLANVSGLDYGQKYFFTVESLNHACDDENKGGVSEVSATTWNKPSKPQDIRIDPKVGGVVDLIWESPEEDGGTPVTGYIVEYNKYSKDDTEYANSLGQETIDDITDTSYHFESLDSSLVYELKVAAVNAVGTGEYETLITDILLKPAAPELVSVTSGNNGAYITANNVKNNGGMITSYNVYYKLHDSEQDFVHLSNVNAIRQSLYNIFVNGLVNGEEYDIAVSVINSAGESAMSEPKTIKAGLPTPVKNLAIEPQLGQIQTMKITFDPADGNGSDITGYDVYVGGRIVGKTQRFTIPDTDKLVKISDTEYDYDASNRISGDTVEVYVVAHNAIGSSTSETVRSGIGAPGAPTLTDYYTDNEGVHFTWESAEANGYVITDYKAYIVDSTGEPIGFSFGNDGTNYGYIKQPDYDFVPGQTYEIKMTATNKSELTSVYSNSGTFLFGVPSRPQQVTTEAGDNSLTVSWTKAEFDCGSPVTGYNIYLNDDKEPTMKVTWRGEEAPYQLYVTDYREGDKEVAYGEPQDNLDGFSVVVGNLANGVAYTAQVSAINERGEGTKSDKSETAIPNGIAGIPRDVTGKAASGTDIDVSWRKPLNEGGGSVNEYIVKAYEVARKNKTTGEYEEVTEKEVASVTSTELKARVFGLNSGSEYKFTVAAVTGENRIGAESAKSAGVRTFTEPSKPVITSLESGVGPQKNLPLTINWKAPEDDGNSPIIGYDVFVDGNKMNIDDGMISAYKTQYVITNDVRLVSGEKCEVTVVVYNGVTGTTEGVSSDSKSIVLGTVSPPDEVTVTADESGTVYVSWSEDCYDASTKEYIDTYNVYVNGRIAERTSDNNVTLTGYRAGQEVKVEISVMNIYHKEGAKSDPQVIYIGAPVRVLNVSADPVKEGALVRWTPGDIAVTNDDFKAQEYIICVDGEPYDSLAEFGTGTLQKTIDGLEGGREYEITVVAGNQYGNSPDSNTVKVTPWSNPDVVKISNIKPGVGSFSFTVEDVDGKGTEIFDHNVYVEGNKITNKNATDNKITVYGVTDGRTLHFYATAIGIAADGSELEGIAPNDAYTVITGVPAAPSYVNAIPGDNKATVVFSKSDDVSLEFPVTKYEIYQGDALVATVNANEISADGKYYKSIDGLENGKGYYFSVLPYNSNGSGEHSNSVYVIPGTPGLPIIEDIKPSSRELLVSWSEPEANSGKITKYTVYVDGVPVLDTTDTSATVKGLDNGTEYMIAVSASNYLGEGCKSEPVKASPAGVSEEVVNVRAENLYENDKPAIILTWDKPADDGGKRITDYTVTGEGLIDTTITETGGTARITNIECGTEYIFEITPVNDEGPGKTHAETVTSADIPGAPNIVGAISRDSSIFAMWKEPSSDGGMGIDEYIVYAVPEDGGSTVKVHASENDGTLTRNEKGELNAVITGGLNVNAVYKVTVSAVNKVGEGPQSRSIELTVRNALKATVPGAPADVQAVGIDRKVLLSWKAPLDDGNSTITEYQIWVGNSPDDMGRLYTADTIDGYTFSYTDENLVNGKTRYYKIKAINDVSAEGGEFSRTVDATPIYIAPPTAPEWLEFSNEGDGQSTYEINARGNEMTIRWTESEADPNGGQISYEVYINSILVDTVSGTEYKFKNPEENKKYDIEIRAIDEVGGETAVAKPITATKDLNIRKGDENDGFKYDEFYVTGVYANIDKNYDGREDSKADYDAPSVPQNVSLSSDMTSAVLTWEAPTENGGIDITGYNIYINSDKYTVEPGDVEDGNGCKYEFSYTYGQLYSVAVQAFNKLYEGPISDMQFINPDIEPPTDMKAEVVKDESSSSKDIDINLEWTIPNNQATEYVLYVNGAPMILNAETDVTLMDENTVSYVYTGQINNEYNFAVSSKYGKNESTLTNAKYADTRENIPVPEIVSVEEQEDGTAKVTWKITYDEDDTRADKFIVRVNGEDKAEVLADKSIAAASSSRRTAPRLVLASADESEEYSAELMIEEVARVKVAAESKRGTVSKDSESTEYTPSSISKNESFESDAPLAPKEGSLTYTIDEDNKVTLMWENAEESEYNKPVDHYNVYISDNDPIEVTGDEYTFDGEAGSYYTVKVEPIAEDGTPGPSARIVVEVPETDPDALSKPRLEIDLNDAKDKVTIKSDKQDDVTYYLLVNGQYELDDEGNKVPITLDENGEYVYSLDGESTNYNFQLEIVKQYDEDGSEVKSVSDIVSVNTTQSGSIDESYNSNKPIITGTISYNTQVKVFWQAPEKIVDDDGNVIEKGDISEYRIVVDNNELTETTGRTTKVASVKADAKELVYTIDFDSLTGQKKKVQIRAYKENANGEPFPVSISDPWIATPEVNQVSKDDFDKNNKDAEKENPDVNGDGESNAEDTKSNTKEIRIPIEMYTPNFTAELVDQSNEENTKQFTVEETEEGKFELVLEPDETIDYEDMVFNIVIRRAAYTRYTMTDIPHADLMDGSVVIDDVVMYPGDLNQDGRITSTDSVKLTSNIDKGLADAELDELITWGDLNADGRITSTDSVVLSSNLGRTEVSAAWVKKIG